MGNRELDRPERGHGVRRSALHDRPPPGPDEPARWREWLEAVRSADDAALRDALVVPGLLSTLRSNLRRGTRDVRLFEIGRVFLSAAGAPREERRLGLLLTGGANTHWSDERRRPADERVGWLHLGLRRWGLGRGRRGLRPSRVETTTYRRSPNSND